MRKQRRRSAAQLISALVFATQIVQSLFFLNLKFQASSRARHYSPKVLVIPRKRWLRPDMSEKLLTGKLNLNTNTQASSVAVYSPTARKPRTGSLASRQLCFRHNLITRSFTMHRKYILYHALSTEKLSHTAHIVPSKCDRNLSV